MIYRLGTRSDTATPIDGGAAAAAQAQGVESALDAGLFDVPPRLQLDRGPAAPPANALLPAGRAAGALRPPPSLFAVAQAPAGSSIRSPPPPLPAAAAGRQPSAADQIFAPQQPSLWQRIASWWPSS